MEKKPYPKTAATTNADKANTIERIDDITKCINLICCGIPVIPSVNTKLDTPAKKTATVAKKSS
jgi:hypothetical protein